MKYLKEEKGFTGMDIMIAVIVVTLFTGIIVTLSYNIYLATTSVKKISAANSYIVDIFETVDLMYYDEINEQALATEFNGKYGTDEQNTQAKAVTLSSGDETINPYRVEIGVNTYQTTNEELPQLDLVKIITVNVKYKVGLNREQILTMTKVKKRESLKVPNAPDIEALASEEAITDTNKIKPIKYINEKWQVCDKNDVNWYNYDNGAWATVLVTNQTLDVGTEIEVEQIGNMGDLYYWIPRYSYTNATPKDIVFDYGISSRYVRSTPDTEENINDVYQELPELSLAGYISDLFDENGGTVKKSGRWISETETNEVSKPDYYTILNDSEYKRKEI